MSSELEKNGSPTICMLRVIPASFQKPKYALLLLPSVTHIGFAPAKQAERVLGLFMPQLQKCGP